MTIEQRMDMDFKEINSKAKETLFLSTGVPYCDGTYDEDYFPVEEQHLQQLGNRISEKNPQLSFMLIACCSCEGKGACLVYVYSTNDKLSTLEWMENCELSCIKEDFGAVCCEFPIKEKDVIINKSCNYLRKLDLIHDEDEETIPFDINAD